MGKCASSGPHPNDRPGVRAPGIFFFRRLRDRRGGNMITKVINTVTGDSFCYTLPPEEALVAAYRAADDF